MDTKNNRLGNLRKIIKNTFGKNAGACADALVIKRPQMSRWVTRNEDARQGISEESARAIEAKLGLRRGSLDEDPDMAVIDNTFDDVIKEFAWVYRHATQRGKNYLRDAIDGTRAAYMEDKPASVHLHIIKDDEKKA